MSKREHKARGHRINSYEISESFDFTAPDGEVEMSNGSSNELWLHRKASASMMVARTAELGGISPEVVGRAKEC